MEVSIGMMVMQIVSIIHMTVLPIILGIWMKVLPNIFAFHMSVDGTMHGRKENSNWYLQSIC